MNWDRMKGNWRQLKGRVHQQWSRLTDDDLEAISGQREVLSGRIQETYGISKDEAERQIRRFEDSHAEEPAVRSDRKRGDESRAPQR